MTKISKGHDTHVKFDIRGQDFAEFKQACQRENVSMSSVMRMLVVLWNAYVLSGEIDLDRAEAKASETEMSHEA